MKIQRIFAKHALGVNGGSAVANESTDVELCEFDARQWIEMRVRDSRGNVETRIIPIANIRYLVVEPAHLKMAKARGGKGKPVEG